VDGVAYFDPPFRVIFLTEASTIDFRAQESLIRHFHSWVPLSGSFDHSFPELNKITRNFQTLEIDKFDPILEAEQNRNGESFEAFGVKFPAEATTRWGVLIILAVQLYFWIHLRELSQKLQPGDAGWEVAFIGMYTSLPSRIVYFISSCILPVLAVSALGIRGLAIGDYQWPFWASLTCGIAVSIALAGVIWRSAPKRNTSL
jgi:hypothetical protein